jgi:uncharacterized protein (TIGR00725 family)
VAAYVAVVGSGVAAPATDAPAQAVGRELARRGAVLVCGGLEGVMEAACRGAVAEGGSTIGLLPGDDRAAANPHVTIAIATGLGELRNGLIARAADAVIAIGGEFGTLSEIGFALKLGRPVIGLATWELARHGAPDEAIVRAHDPVAAVTIALELGAARAFRH